MFKRRYKLKLFPLSSHQTIARILAEYEPQSVLDLGCAQGFLGRILKTRIKKMAGVDKIAVGKLKNYSRIYRRDLDRIDFSFLKNQKFEVIVMADVLEHLINPPKVLNLSLNYLEKKGFVIISVPNMDYWLVRIILFLHLRPKSDHGPFDRTHLHDFNRQKLQTLTAKNKLKLVRSEVTAIPLPMLSPLFNQGNWLHFLYQLNFLIAKRWPDFFAYQLIVVCQKRSA